MTVKLTLPDNISSPDQLLDFVDNLTAYQSYIRRLNVANKVKVGHPAKIEAPAMPVELISFLDTQFGDEGATIERLEKIKDFFLELRKDSPTVHIMMAFLPTTSERIMMTHWFRENIAPNILLNFSQNSDVIGGLIVRTKTKIFDLSFRTILLSNQKKLMELI